MPSGVSTSIDTPLGLWLLMTLCLLEPYCQLEEGRDEEAEAEAHLTSSSCHPKIFVKEFSYFLMSCHQHCLGVNLLVQR